MLRWLLRRSGVDPADPEVRNYCAWLSARGAPARWASGIHIGTEFLRSAVRLRSRLRGFLRLLRSRAGDAGRRPSSVGNDLPSERLTCSPSPFFFSPDEIAPLAAYARRHRLAEVEAIIAWADRVRRGIFPLVSGLEFDFRSGVDWHHRFADQEHLFYLNRFAYAPVLAKAFVYTGDSIYVGALMRLLEDWGQRNPPGDPETWESYSVAERICNWTLTAYLLQTSADFQGFLRRWLFPQLARHATYLAGHLETGTMHNHLINDGRALFIYGLSFPHLDGSEACRRLGWEILAREMPRQTRPDGVFREQSTHYHLLLTRTYTEVVWLGGRLGWPVSEEIWRLLEKMHEVAASMIRPDGSIPFMGDICPDIESRHLAGVLALGAVLFKRGDFKRPEAITEYALWYLGGEGLAAWEALDGEPPARTVVAFPRGGLAFLARRSSVPTHVSLHCDSLGEVIFHGDLDPLGLAVWWDGREIVVDTGNYSYNRDEWWAYFKGAAAQNTVLVDGLAPWVAPRLRRWFLPGYSAVQGTLKVGVGPAEAEFAEASHTGYARLPQPVKLTRRVALSDTGVTVTDFLEGGGDHDVEVRFHLGPGRAVLADGEVSLLDEEGTAVASLRPVSDTEFTVDLLEGWVARGYGLKRSTQLMRVRFRGRLPARVDTVIEPASRPQAPRTVRAVATL